MDSSSFIMAGHVALITNKVPCWLHLKASQNICSGSPGRRKWSTCCGWRLTLLCWQGLPLVESAFLWEKAVGCVSLKTFGALLKGIALEGSTVLRRKAVQCASLKIICVLYRGIERVPDCIFRHVRITLVVLQLIHIHFRQRLLYEIFIQLHGLRVALRIRVETMVCTKQKSFKIKKCRSLNWASIMHVHTECERHRSVFPVTISSGCPFKLLYTCIKSRLSSARYVIYKYCMQVRGVESVEDAVYTIHAIRWRWLLDKMKWRTINDCHLFQTIQCMPCDT